MGELREPVGTDTHRLLRRAVLEHVRGITSRTIPVVVHVGVPGGPTRRFVVRRDEPTDHTLRTDIVAAMAGRVVPGRAAPWCWVSRAGDLGLHDLDAQWLAAARAAYAEAGADLTMVVVTRQGWRDPRSGATRTWVRLRGGRR